jgi:hypothetical protein
MSAPLGKIISYMAGGEMGERGGVKTVLFDIVPVKVKPKPVLPSA